MFCLALRKMTSVFSSETFRLEGGDGSGRLLWRRTLDGALNHPIRVLFYDLLCKEELLNEKIY